MLSTPPLTATATSTKLPTSSSSRAIGVRASRIRWNLVFNTTAKCLPGSTVTIRTSEVIHLGLLGCDVIRASCPLYTDSHAIHVLGACLPRKHRSRHDLPPHPERGRLGETSVDHRIEKRWIGDDPHVHPDSPLFSEDRGLSNIDYAALTAKSFHRDPEIFGSLIVKLELTNGHTVCDGPGHVLIER